MQQTGNINAYKTYAKILGFYCITINQLLSYIFNIFDRYGLVTDYDYTDYFNSLDTRVAKRTDGYNDVSSGLEIGVINFSFEFDVDLILIFISSFRYLTSILSIVSSGCGTYWSISNCHGGVCQRYPDKN